MIIHSPESMMPEPYKTYVQQRNTTIGDIIEDIVDKDVQLCPRAILPHEHIGDALIYGAEVRSEDDGLKTALYEHSMSRYGSVVSSFEEAQAYFYIQQKAGNTIRIKDPRESDGCGQAIVTNIEELAAKFGELSLPTGKCILMPHLQHITDRVSIGRINLGAGHQYCYVGQESTVALGDRVAYGGTRLALFRSSRALETRALKQFDIDPTLAVIGFKALYAYQNIAITSGRVSVDVIKGTTQSGQLVADVVDLTPRVGGATPAEVLAIRALGNNHIAVASSQLHYGTSGSSRGSGILFVDAPALAIIAKVEEVL